MKKRIIASASCIIAGLLIGTAAAYAVATTSMDVNDFEKTMDVGTSQTITARIYPEDSEDVIYYSSSDPSVASISPGGKIEAHKKGRTTISVKSGSVEKTMNLRVIVKTDTIRVKSTYIILKKGEKFNLEAEVSPKGADQKLKYKSSNEGVVKVNGSGRIRAVGDGSASVTISNSDMTVSAAVVVNYGQSGGGESYRSEDSDDGTGENDAAAEDEERNAAAVIRKAETQGYADKDTLRILRDTKDTLCLENDNYDIILDGRKIANCDNPLSGNTTTKHTEDGMLISINDGEPLPGPVDIQLKGSSEDKFRYYYIVEKDGGPYTYLGEISKGRFTIDIPGKFLLSEKKISRFSIDPKIPVIAGAALAFLFSVYVVVRRRYWFW